MLALTYFVSWNTAPLLRFLLAVLVLLAVTPVVAGCCTAIAGNAGAWAMVPVVFAGAMAVKP